jgi:L-ascorbate metabolism protein UlaG (beta-lactamase superfamily)
MKKFNKLYVFILVVALCGFTIPKKEELRVTYLANCGFLYETNNSKVLIDPFGTEYGSFFYLPSDETKEKIIDGKIPFNNIDLLLITHIHGDHFNAKLTEGFLLNNKKAKVICPSQVYRQMKDSCKSFAQIKSQIISPALSMNESKKMKIKGISVTAIRMQHGANRSLEGLSYSDYTDYEKTEDFGYIIHFSKKTVFHQGDGCLKLNEKALKNIDCSIDIAHLSFFDWDSTSLDILKKDIKAEKVIFMHGTKPAKELESEQFKKIAPQLIFFKSELESRTF